MKVVHCKKEPFDVYIGRPSKWGNPFTHKENTTAKEFCESREDAVKKYKEWILTQDQLLKDLPELKGKILACWCKPKACHGDVLLELANRPQNHDFLIVNADTDSISFCKPDHAEISEIERKALVKEINDISPEFMIWGDDGLYRRLICLKAKNYIMQDEKGKIKLKGSSLKDAKLEPAIKAMIKEFIDSMLEDRNNFLDIYLKYVKMINNITDIKPWVSKRTISAKTLASTRENEAKVCRAIVGSDYQEGDKCWVFFDENEELVLMENFKGTYHKDKLYEKLFKATERFGSVLDRSNFLNFKLKRNKEALSKLND